MIAHTLTTAEPIDSGTRGADATSLATTVDAWDRMITHTLMEWSDDPTRLADDGIIAPTQRMIAFAIGLARLFREWKWPGPNRAVTDGDGGIVFERWTDRSFQSIEIGADYSIHLNSFTDGKLQSRERLPQDT